MINVQKVSKFYGETQVLDAVDFKMNQGDHCSIKGASGSGKSTFLYLLGGLETIDYGSVSILDFQLDNSNESDLADFRNQHIGFIFQFHFLLPSIKVKDNLLLPARIGGVLDKEVQQRIQSMVDFLGIEYCLEKYPFQLSGGEQQRVNIVRAFSLNPELVLCDEPTGNLDSENTEKVVRLIKDFAKENGTSLIVVTHDNEVASEFDHHYEMRDGVLYSTE